MDTHNDGKMAFGDLKSKIAGHGTVVGAKQLKRAVADGRALTVFLALNADPAITEPLAALCQRSGVEHLWVRSKQELGLACGIEVAAAAAATVK